MKDKIIELIKKYTGHSHAQLTSRGNSAIFLAMHIARGLKPGNVLIPDQGGWLYYKKAAARLSMDVDEVKTDNGVIDLEDLKSKTAVASCLIYQNPAGYFAEQPMKKIWDLCSGKCAVILDASGSIGNEMCNGRYADIIVGSFGKWKPVDIGYGGFVSADDKKYFEKLNWDFKLEEFDESCCEELYEKLKNVKKKYSEFGEIRKKILGELKVFDIIHPDKKGINVKFKDDAEKGKIIEYCEKHKYQYTICPRYIRVECDAVSIEVKRK